VKKHLTEAGKLTSDAKGSIFFTLGRSSGTLGCILAKKNGILSKKWNILTIK